MIPNHFVGVFSDKQDMRSGETVAYCKMCLVSAQDFGSLPRTKVLIINLEFMLIAPSCVMPSLIEQFDLLIAGSERGALHTLG